MSPEDIENGLGESAGSIRESRNLSTTSSHQHEAKNGKSELEIFQTLVGIKFLAPGGGQLPDEEKTARPANPLHDIFLPSKAAEDRFRNRGLYDRALSQDLKNRSMYTISHYVISGLYILQIVLAATFTALAADVHSSRTTLTVLGALNTVIAGILAWLTGKGMPVRFRSSRDQYREVVKAIEKSERTLAEIDYIKWPPGGRPDPIKERDKLEKMYEEARLDQEANYPDTHQSPSANQKTQENQELQEKIGKSKTQKVEKKGEIEALQAELETLRNSMKVDPKSSE